MTDDARKIATIDPNHTVALFTPETESFKKAASAGTKSVVNFRHESENGV